MDNKEHKAVFEGGTAGGYICADIHEGQLPKFLENAVKVSDMPQQQDMLLLSTLTACSWALPNIRLLHDKGSKVYYPNLMTMVVAPPASGKGAMANARRLIEPIDRVLQMIERRAILSDDLNDVNFFESLMECGGNGFMLVTEMDLISKAWKKDSGYSSLFRQAFEHESWSRERHRGAKKVRFNVDEPRLSVVLSGTENQVKPLLGTGENGLACRFLPYIVNDVNLFDVNVLLHGDRYNENGAMIVYDRLASELYNRWRWLLEQQEGHLWSLTDEQANLLGQLITEGETMALERIEKQFVAGKLSKIQAKHMVDAIAAVIHRLAVIVKRIGCVLSMMRLEIGSELPEVIYCQDVDFATMTTIGEKILYHAYVLTEMLVLGENYVARNIYSRSDAEERIENLLAALPEKFNMEAAKRAADELSIPRATLFRYLKKLVEEKRLKHETKDEYQIIK